MASLDAARHSHGGERVLIGGAPLETAAGALIAIHGRGGGAEDIFALGREIAPPSVAILAPQAAGSTWYPYRFLEPTERNEPYLSSALRVVADVIAQLGEHRIPPERVALMGFSQGACLALEAAARNARRYAGVIGFSGGLIGPPGTPFEYAGSLDGTPVFLGCSDIDPHIPVERVRESGEVLANLGAAIDMRIYPGMGHTVNEDEIAAAKKLLQGLAAAPLP